MGVSSGLYFRFHYFLLTVPAVALLMGMAVETSLYALQTKKAILRALPLMAFAAVFVWAVALNFKYYFRLNPVQACRFTYGMGRGFPEAEKIAGYLQQHTTINDRIGILGSEPEVNFYAHRLSATGYIYFYELMENQPYWQKMQQQAASEFEASHPAYVLYFNDSDSWLTTMSSARLPGFFSWANAYLKQNYERVGVVELVEPESIFLWGDQARAANAQSTITIFKRKN